MPALTENTTWSAGDLAHAQYMVKNDLVTHYETPGTPYYTVAGDTAARNSNIYVSSSTSTTDDQAIDWWMQAPFHALGMMDPRLTATGFGSYREVKSGWDMGAAVDVLRGNSFAGGTYPVYFPGNGATEPLTTYGGNEFPDPLQACSGYAPPTGLPVFVQVGGNVATTVGAVHSFTGNGVSLAHCVIDSSNAAVGSSLRSRGAVLLIPRQPLQRGVRYTVALTVNNASYTWSFTVGPFFSLTGVSPAYGSPSGGTTVTITGSGFNNGVTAVNFGTTPAPSFTVVNDSTITAVSPAHAVGTVDITLTMAIGTSQATPADRYSFATPCTSVTISAAPPSPVSAGTQVSLTGTATCPSANPVYEFWLRPASHNAWQVAQAFSTNNKFSWNTTGFNGIVYVGVWARDANSPGIVTSGMGSTDAFAGLTYSLNTARCGSASVAAGPGSPQIAGTQVTLTAGSTGCPNPRYEFWARPASSTAWTVVQAYSTANTFVWNSNGAAAGTWYFGVWARDASSTASTFDANASAPFTVTAASCGAVSIAAAPSSVVRGGMVTLTATATGCTHAGPLYEFWIRPAAQTTWQLARAYSTSATFTWNSAGAVAGTCYIGVWAKDASSPTTFDANASTNVSVT